MISAERTICDNTCINLINPASHCQSFASVFFLRNYEIPIRPLGVTVMSVGSIAANSTRRCSILVHRILISI